METSAALNVNQRVKAKSNQTANNSNHNRKKVRSNGLNAVSTKKVSEGSVDIKEINLQLLEVLSMLRCNAIQFSSKRRYGSGNGTFDSPKRLRIVRTISRKAFLLAK